MPRLVAGLRDMQWSALGLRHRARAGVDFGGCQDHTINGGDEVRSLGCTELIAPLINAVQELATRNNELAGRNAALETEQAVLQARLEGSEAAVPWLEAGDGRWQIRPMANRQ
jgi:hypothetical protein